MGDSEALFISKSDQLIPPLSELYFDFIFLREVRAFLGSHPLGF